MQANILNIHTTFHSSTFKAGNKNNAKYVTHLKYFQLFDNTNDVFSVVNNCTVRPGTNRMFILLPGKHRLAQNSSSIDLVQDL